MAAPSSRLEFFAQETSSSCAPACLRMIAHVFGIDRSEAELRTLCHTDELGTYIGDLCDAAAALGLQAEIANRTALGSMPLAFEIAYVNRLPLDGVDAVHCVVAEFVSEAEVHVLDPLVGSRSLQLTEWDEARAMVRELILVVTSPKSG